MDVFDASTRRFWMPEFEGSDLNLAAWAKKITGKAAMTVGSVGLEGPLDSSARLRKQGDLEVGFAGLDALYEKLARGDFDLVGIGRALLVDPDWATIVREGRYEDLHSYTAAASIAAVV